MSLETSQSAISAPVRPIVMMTYGRLLDAEKAAEYLGISRRNFLDRVAKYELPSSRRIGQRVLWDIRTLDDFVDVLFGRDHDND